MICYDGSSTARALVEATVDLFKDIKPEIHLVLIADLNAAVGHNEDYDWKEYEKKLATRSKWIRKKGYEVDTHIFSGNPKPMILEAVTKLKPKVAIVGRIGDPHVHLPFHQKIHEALIKQSSCPVLVI
jgi:nucleotide-binding universal stress UspA family protein